MQQLKDNLLVQFSAVSFTVMAVLAIIISMMLTSRMRDDILVVYAAVANGFVILYGGLLYIIWQGWKTIVRQRNQLQSFNQELEKQVEERTAALQATNQELEAFCYSVSHDLRAPLRAIDGFSQALLEDYSDFLEPMGQEYLHRVRAASQRMAQLIDDLLSLSRTTRSEIHWEEVDLSALAQSIVTELADSQPEQSVEWKIAPGVKSQGDAHLLRVALENLLGNAWKFTSKQPQAVIEFGAAQQSGQTVYFVRDNGAGFDMAYASKLFGAFQRLHGADEFEGTGIGLATVQRIVRRLGGSIWAEGAVGQGATFYFTL